VHLEQQEEAARRAEDAAVHVALLQRLGVAAPAVENVVVVPRLELGHAAVCVLVLCLLLVVFVDVALFRLFYGVRKKFRSIRAGKKHGRKTAAIEEQKRPQKKGGGGTRREKKLTRKERERHSHSRVDGADGAVRVVDGVVVEVVLGDLLRHGRRQGHGGAVRLFLGVEKGRERSVGLAAVAAVVFWVLGVVPSAIVVLLCGFWV